MDKKNDKAVLVGGKLVKGKLAEGKNKGDDTWELDIEEKDLEVNKEAARNCPVSVIKIYDEQGKGVNV